MRSETGDDNTISMPSELFPGKVLLPGGICRSLWTVPNGHRFSGESRTEPAIGYVAYDFEGLWDYGFGTTSRDRTSETRTPEKGDVPQEFLKMNL